MCKVLLKKNIVERENKISRFFTENLFNLFQWSNHRRKATFVTLIIGCSISFMFYGSEFIPKLNEGALYVRATLLIVLI